jgi:hypothetical protein
MTGTPSFTDCCSWRGRRDSCHLALAESQGGLPENGEPATHAEREWRAVRDGFRNWVVANAA